MNYFILRVGGIGCDNLCLTAVARVTMLSFALVYWSCTFKNDE